MIQTLRSGSLFCTMIMGNQVPSDIYHIEEINIHPGWIARQECTEKEYGQSTQQGWRYFGTRSRIIKT